MRGLERAKRLEAQETKTTGTNPVEREALNQKSNKAIEILDVFPPNLVASVCAMMIEKGKKKRVRRTGKKKKL